MVMISVSFHTFGCKCNVSDSNSIALKLMDVGTFEVLDAEGRADVHIVNTCTVTSSADAQARNLIRKLDRGNKGSLIIVTGCSCRRATEEYKKLPLENNKLRVIDNLKSDVTEFIVKELGLAGKSNGVNDNVGGGVSGAVSSGAKNIAPAFRTRAFVKIQDGCRSFCSYCIVPFVRGEEKSRSLDDVVSEVRALEKKDIKEIVLTGINVGNYEFGLEKLIENILNSTSKLRIRLSSIRPSKVSDRLLDLMLEKRLCPHFHISLQSGCDKILKLMNRLDYTAKDFVSISQKIDKKLGGRNPFITADVIVGFPHEKEDEFKQTLTTLEATPINKLHVFVFSPRPGTKAFDMKELDKGSLIHERRDILLNFSDTRYKDSLRAMKGKTVEVLWETDNFGHSENYYPTTGIGEPNKIVSCVAETVDLEKLALMVS